VRVVAIFIHGDLNGSPFFDIVWTTSLMFDTVAMIPQLALMYKCSSHVEGLNAHYVAAIVVSRALAFWFWFHGFPEIAPSNGGANTAGWLIIGCHSFQLLVCGDFMMQYVRNVCRQGQEALKVLEEK